MASCSKSSCGDEELHMSQALPLIVGIGQVFRGDDSAGHRIAMALQEEDPAGFRALAVHQLLPELVAQVHQASRVLFIDATVDPRRCLQWAALAVEPIQAALLSQPFSHQLNPEGVLALTLALYGHHPPAWQLLIPALQWRHGDRLSPLTATSCSAALALARAWGVGHA